MLGEVETRGSTQYVGKPLLQYKPSVSRRDATYEKMENCNPKNGMKINNKVSSQIPHQL